ncbi:MAG: hypothetical protein QS98_C0001G0016 [archaeon GW2011_AR3]|nr:MAG: hypothetical protein QS98_C0001G0016 [archaeon GW2011_AR3]
MVILVINSNNYEINLNRCFRFPHRMQKDSLVERIEHDIGKVDLLRYGHEIDTVAEKFEALRKLKGKIPDGIAVLQTLLLFYKSGGHGHYFLHSMPKKSGEDRVDKGKLARYLGVRQVLFPDVHASFFYPDYDIYLNPLPKNLADLTHVMMESADENLLVEMPVTRRLGVIVPYGYLTQLVAEHAGEKYVKLPRSNGHEALLQARF